MNVMEAIRARRAVRSYDARPVEEAQVRALLDAAVQAPSARDAQPRVFAVVQNAARGGRGAHHRRASPRGARAGAPRAAARGLLEPIA